MKDIYSIHFDKSDIFIIGQQKQPKLIDFTVRCNGVYHWGCILKSIRCVDNIVYITGREKERMTITLKNRKYAIKCKSQLLKELNKIKKEHNL